MHKFCKYAKQSFAHVNLVLDLLLIVLYAHTNFTTTSCKESRYKTNYSLCRSITSTLYMMIILETDWHYITVKLIFKPIAFLQVYSQITLYYDDNISIYCYEMQFSCHWQKCESVSQNVSNPLFRHVILRLIETNIMKRTS